MKAGKGKRTVSGIAFLLSLAILISGCSSRSQLKLYVRSIVGTSGDNLNKEYLECDIIGSNLGGCTSIQDQVSVTVELDAPGSLGPSLGAYLTGYTIEYFYFDPADGALRGPVSDLTVYGTNMKVPISTGTAVIDLAAVTFRFKTWSVGVDCHDVTGYTGLDNITRFIIRITIHGEDTTGKTMSADGSILAYLYDYAPGPLDPQVSNDTTRTWCFNMTPEAYWSALCP
jgi:hypothetical protein